MSKHKINRISSALLAAGLVLTILAGCDDGTHVATPTVAATALISTPTAVKSAAATPTVAGCNVPNLNLQVTVDDKFNDLFANKAGEWLGADGAYSVPLPDGRSVWLFGDTILGQRKADGSQKLTAFINNSLIVQDGDKLTPLYGGSVSKPTAEITPTEKDTWYWTSGGAVDAGQLHVFLLHMKRAGNGTPGFDFTSAGNTSVASFTLPDLKLVNVRVLPDSGATQYGVSVVEDGDYQYIYGLEDLQSKKYGHVARAQRGDLLGDWQFYDGAGWSHSPISATRIVSDVSNLSVIRYHSGYLLVGMENTFAFGNKIIAYFSCSLVGPWQSRTVVYTVREAKDGIITYLAHPHPEFSKDGDLLISYCLNNTKPQAGMNDNVYRPHFIRVRFP